MTKHSIPTPSRRPARRRANLTIRPDYLDAARGLGINLSEAAERGIGAAIREAEAAAWLEENRAALDGYNRYIEEHGLPLAKHRLF